MEICLVTYYLLFSKFEGGGVVFFSRQLHGWHKTTWGSTSTCLVLHPIKFATSRAYNQPLEILHFTVPDIP